MSKCFGEGEPRPQSQSPAVVKIPVLLVDCFDHMNQFWPMRQEMKSPGEHQERFSFLMKQTYSGSSACCGLSTNHLEALKGEGKGRKTAATCIFAGVIGPSSLGISCVGRIVYLA
jgi:hypothetical protein